MLQPVSTDFFAALSDANRLHITQLLAENGTMSAGQISDQFSISAPAVSQHLKVLREAQLIQVERKAQLRLYSINTETFTACESWLRQMKKKWSQRLDQLDKVLSKTEEGV